MLGDMIQQECWQWTKESVCAGVTDYYTADSVADTDQTSVEGEATSQSIVHYRSTTNHEYVLLVL